MQTIKGMEGRLDIKGLQLIRPQNGAGALNLSLDAGAAVVVVGRNGVGKSTLLQTLAGLLPARQGSVRWDGEDVHRMSPEARAGYAALVTSTPPRSSAMTVADVMELGLRAGGRISGPAQVQMAMDTAGISQWSGLSLNALSDGMAQRVMMARAAVQGEGMLLLDEPTAFLDVVGRRDMLHQMGEWRSAGRILWLATHDLEGAEAAGWVTHWLHLETGADTIGTLYPGPFVAEVARAALMRQ